MRRTPMRHFARTASKNKAILNLVPGISEKQANRLLNLIVADLSEASQKGEMSTPIMGSLEIDEYNGPMGYNRHPSFENTREIKGVVGEVSRFVLEVDLSDLERLIRFPLSSTPLVSSRTNFKKLAEEITEKIEDHIFAEDLKKDAADNAAFEIKNSLADDLQIESLNLYDYEMKIVNIRPTGLVLAFTFETKVEFEVSVFKEEDF